MAMPSGFGAFGSYTSEFLYESYGLMAFTVCNVQLEPMACGLRSNLRWAAETVDAVQH